jgi:uncharacterized protein
LSPAPACSCRSRAEPRTPGAPIAFLGEAKYRDRKPRLAELSRLEHIRALLAAAGHDASATKLGLFSAAVFTGEVVAEAARSRGRILLARLGTLYGLHDRRV